MTKVQELREKAVLLALQRSREIDASPDLESLIQSARRIETFLRSGK